MADYIQDKKITQDQADQFQSPMELDLMALFRVLLDDILQTSEKFEGTPDSFINKVVSFLSDDNVNEVKKAKPVGTISNRKDGSRWKKMPDGSWKQIIDQKEKTNNDFEKASDKQKEKINEIINSDRKLKRLNLEIENFDNKGNYVLYHGTNEKGQSLILSDGLKPAGSGEGDNSKSFTTTTSKGAAEEFAKGYNGDKIVKIKIPLNELSNYLWPGGETAAYQDTQHALKISVPPKYIEINKSLKENDMNNYHKKLNKSASKSEMFEAAGKIIEIINKRCGKK